MVVVALVVAVPLALLLGFVVGWQTRGHLEVGRRPAGRMVRIPPGGGR